MSCDPLGYMPNLNYSCLMLFMNVYEFVKCNVDYPVCLAKFWGSSSVAIMLPDFCQNLELRMIYTFMFFLHGAFTC